MKIQVLVFMSEIKFDLALKKIKFSVSFMLLFTVIKILSTLRLSRQKPNFFPSHFVAIWSCLLHKMQSRKRKIIQSNSNGFEILPKVNLGHNL